MPIVGVNQYPSIQTITNLVRSDVRDDMPGLTNTVGEGQILIDNMAVTITMANFFCSAARELARQLRLVNASMLIGDNYVLTGIPPINGPMGLAVADPAVQVNVGLTGYYDGSQMHANWKLPAGCFQVVRVWERETASQDNFQDLGEPSDGLAGVYQTSGFGRWEWRQDAVYLPGSLDTRDLRFRWLMILQPQFVVGVNPATTYLPIMDCEEAIARKIARMYAIRQGGMMYQMAKMEETAATNAFLNQQVHRQQGTNYETLAYGDEGPPILNQGN